MILSVMVRRRLKTLRAGHDPFLSQYALAQKIGMGFNRYWRIEKGYAAPTPAEQEAIARGLGVTEQDLFHEK